MTTQGTFLTAIRERLDETTANQFSDVFLRRLVNEGAKDIARKTESLEDTDTIAATISPVTSQYSIATDVIRVHNVEFHTTGDSTIKRMLEFVDIRNMEAFGWSNRGLTANYPQYYTVWGATRALTLNVFPAPSVAGTFTLYVYKLPAELATADNSAAATNVDIPQGWDDILLDYMEFRALRQDRDPRWAEAKAIYDENLSTMFDNTRRWVDQAGLITPNGMGGYLPTWLVDGAY